MSTSLYPSGLCLVGSEIGLHSFIFEGNSGVWAFPNEDVWFMNEKEKIAHVRSCFPSVEEAVCFNTGTCGPLPESSMEKMREVMEHSCRKGRASIPDYMEYLEEIEGLRADLGRLIGAHPDEVTPTQHTTEAMNHILWGFDWQPGDQIITSTHEHQGLLAPLSMLHIRKGVDVVYLPFNGKVVHDRELLEDALEPNTRMVALSHVSFIDGFSLPIEALASICNDEDIPILVDGAQAVGAFPINVKEMGVDFYAAPAQKWLCGPEGMGFLYIHKEWFSRIKPTYTGIFGVRELHWIDQTSPYMVPASGARRFQSGGLFRPVVYGWRESLRLLEKEIGWVWSGKRAQHLRQKLYTELQDIPGLAMLSPKRDDATLLSFLIEGCDPQALRDFLQTKKIIIRDIPFDTPRIRVSVGFFNNEDDCDKLLHGIREFQKLA